MFKTRYLYLGGRGFSTVASLIFALVYSRDLGLVNRSALALIMTTNALLWVLVTSGSTLTIRRIGWGNVTTSVFRSFVSSILIQYIAIVTLFLGVVSFYSVFKNNIPLNLILVATFYLTVSGLHLIAMEILLSANKFKLAGLLETLTIILQIVIYFLIAPVFELTNATRLLLSFSFSYIFISTLAVMNLGKLRNIGFRLGDPRIFFQESRLNHLLGASLGFMDRIDRVLVGFLLATPVLGKYAVATSLVALLRFLPDGLSKLLISKNFDLYPNTRFSGRILITIIPIVSLLTVLISRLAIDFWLGEEWLLAFSAHLAISFQEVLRGWYQLIANKKILENFSKEVQKSALWLPGIGIPIALTTVGFLGLIAIPLAYCTTYLVNIFYLTQKVKL